MKFLSKPLSTVYLLALAFVFSSCGGEDPYGFRVDYSGAPDPFSTESAEKVETESGLVYYVIEEGKADSVVRRSQVYLFYTGRTSDGEIFDSSYRNGLAEPAIFHDIGSLIAGFREGLIGMKEGGKRVLIIPPELGYGNSPSHELRNDTLRFDIELDDVVY